MKKLNLPRINHITISGRLTRDVDLRYTSSGTPVANIGIANDRPYRDSDGNWQNEVNFLQVVAWAKLAERTAEKLEKGSPVIIEGKLQSSKWEDKNGNNRTTVEINAFRIQHLEREFNPQDGNYQDSQNNEQQNKTTNREEDSDDGIPF